MMYPGVSAMLLLMLRLLPLLILAAFPLFLVLKFRVLSIVFVYSRTVSKWGGNIRIESMYS